MPVVYGYRDAAMYTGGGNTSGGGSIISADTIDSNRNNGNGMGSSGGLAAHEWDPSFHGSVHTATMAVCTVLVIFVVVLGTFGNGLVLISALQCRRLRSNFDVLVYNLAGADFIVCSCLAPTFLYLLFSAPPPAPREFCGGFLFASTLCGLASLLTLVAIAAHRQSRVTGKVKGALTFGRTAAILGAVYFISTGAALGGTLHVTLSWSDSQTTCQAVINSNRVTSNNVILFFVSPVVAVSCIIILVSYCVIARAVRTQTYLRVKALQPLLKNTSGYSKLMPELAAPGRNKLRPPPCPELRQILVESGVPAETATTAPLSQTPHVAKPPARKEKEILKHCACCSCMAALDKENKAVTMCLVVILIIALCWTPLVVSHAIELFTGESIILYQVKLCGIALVFLNSALDPYMYAQNCGRSSHRYGSFLWDVFRCECRLPRPSRSKRLAAVVTASKPAGVTALGGRVTRSPQGANTAGGVVVVGPDCATLQFLQPAEPPAPRDKMPIVKTSSRRGGGVCACHGVKHSKVRGKVTVSSSKNQRIYANNILKFGGHTCLAVQQSYKKAEARHCSRTHAQTGMMSDVRTLVHKSCCHGNSPDDLSLLDS